MRGVNHAADQLRLVITVTGILVVALLALWGSRGILQSVALLSKGLERFGTGEFQQPIAIVGNDELSAVARDANQMAVRLQSLSEQRERNEWLKAAQVGLSDELRGELDPQAVAERALRFLAVAVKALAGALYVHEAGGKLRLVASYAAGGKSSLEPPVAEFAEGEGLVGQAAASGELTVLDDLCRRLTCESAPAWAKPRRGSCCWYRSCISVAKAGSSSWRCSSPARTPNASCCSPCARRW